MSTKQRWLEVADRTVAMVDECLESGRELGLDCRRLEAMRARAVDQRRRLELQPPEAFDRAFPHTRREENRHDDHHARRNES